MSDSAQAQPKAALQRGSALKFVVLLSLVSLFADFVYEGARSITGPYLGQLGANAVVIGAVSGCGEMLGNALRLVSGRAADRTRAYWVITIAGYIVNLFAVPAMAFVGQWQLAAVLVLLERTGKAIRGPARDVILSAAGSQLGQGFAFGLHQALDQVGAIIGPLTIAAILYFHGSMRFGLQILLIPAVVAIAILFFARYLYPHPEDLHVETPEIHAAGLSSTFWIYVAAGSLVAAGTMDYPLIAFHFNKVSALHDAWIPILYAIAMAVDGAAGFYLGKAFDKHGVKLVAIATLFSAAVAPVVFLFNQPLTAALAVSLWGMSLGVQGSIMKATIAKLVNQATRGSAYGLFGLCYGVSWFLGSLALGFFYEHSMPTLIAFSVVTQLIAVPLFFSVAKRMNSVS